MDAGRAAELFAREGPPLLLDAAMGTALIARGLDPAQESAASWAVAHPGEVREVHRSHLAAGAGLVLTDTFGASAPSAEELRAALRLPREAGAARVALSLWAGLAPEAVAAAARAARALEPALDAVWLETGVDLPAALAALEAALGAGPPVVVTLAFTRAARAADELAALAAAGASAVGLNCSPWPAAPGALAALAGRLAADLPVPLVLKPDAGGLAPEAWARELAAAARAGARLLGGCCGTGGEHLARLAAALAAPA